MPLDLEALAFEQQDKTPGWQGGSIDQAFAWVRQGLAGALQNRRGTVLAPVDFEVNTPLSHWVPGRPAVPVRAAARVARLTLFDQLYQGAWGLLSADQQVVRDNFFSGVPVQWAQLNMAYPPMFTVGERSLDEAGVLPEREVRTLLAAIEQATIDVLRYGTAVILVTPQQGAIAVPPAREWFPAPRGEGGALVRPVPPSDDREDVDESTSQVQAWLLEPEGRVTVRGLTVRDGRFDSGMAEISAFGLRQGESDVWAAIGEVDGGVAIPVTTVPRPPSTGAWGESIYPDLIPPVFDLAVRRSLRSLLLDEFSRPKLLMRNKQDAGFTAPPSEGQMVTEEERVKYVEAKRQQRDLWQQDQVYLPEHVESADALTWETNADAINDAIDDDLKSIFAVSPVPAHYYDAARFVPPSGRALEALNARVYNAMQAYRVHAIPRFRRVLALVLATYGYNAASIRALMNEVQIEWLNPLDELTEAGGAAVTGEGVEVE